MVEYIDICDQNGKPLGYKKPRDEVHKLGLFHRVVHVWIVDSEGMVLIQKRTASKESNPSLWDISCAGHIEAGSTSKETAIKELNEELGLLYSENDLEFLFNYKKCCILNNGTYIDNEFPDVYLISTTHPFNLSTLKLQVEEVSDAKLIPHPELYRLLAGDPSFAPVYDPKEEPNFKNCKYYKLIEVLQERYGYR